MKTSPATKPVQINRLVMAVFLSPKYDAGIPTAQDHDEEREEPDQYSKIHHKRAIFEHRASGRG